MLTFFFLNPKFSQTLLLCYQITNFTYLFLQIANFTYLFLPNSTKITYLFFLLNSTILLTFFSKLKILAYLFLPIYLPNSTTKKLLTLKNVNFFYQITNFTYLFMPNFTYPFHQFYLTFRKPNYTFLPTFTGLFQTIFTYFLPNSTNKKELPFFYQKTKFIYQLLQKK